MTTSSDSEPELPETAETIRHRVRVELRIYLVIVAIVCLVVGGIIGRYLFREEYTDLMTVTNQPTLLLGQDIVLIPTPVIESGTLSVYVSGAVVTSQVVTLPQGSLVVDALQAVGGASDDANLDAINLAAPLRDHEHILVPRQADQIAIQTTAVYLNINTATITELEILPNIGPTRAQHIVTYRESHGPFQTKEDIMQVSGIGQATYEELAPFISVDGE